MYRFIPDGKPGINASPFPQFRPVDVDLVLGLLADALVGLLILLYLALVAGGSS